LNNSKRYSSRLHLPTRLLFFMGVSLFGSATAIVLALNRSMAADSLVWRRPLVGSLFILICAVGITTVFVPEKCSGPAHSRQREKSAHAAVDTTSIEKAPISFKGHHLDCGRFASHTITSGNNVFCAACLGLLLGAFAAIVSAILYFFVHWEISEVSFWAVAVGQIGIILGLAQLKFKSYARSTANAIFVLASFLTLTGIDNLLSSIYADLYVLALIVFWLFTRISMSQWDHSRICRECNLPCERKER